MRPWKFKWPEVNHIIQQFEDQDYIHSPHVRKIREELIAALTKRVETVRSEDVRWEFQRVIDDLENCPDEVEALDYELNDVYQLADVYRIWLGDGSLLGEPATSDS